MPGPVTDAVNKSDPEFCFMEHAFWWTAPAPEVHMVKVCDLIERRSREPSTELALGKPL